LITFKRLDVGGLGQFGTCIYFITVSKSVI